MMAKRRANNEGTLFRTQEGRWAAEVYLGKVPKTDKTGKPILDAQGLPVLKRASERKYFKTQGEAREWLTAKARSRDQGMLIKPTGETLAQFFARWLPSVAMSRKPATAESYRWIAETYILPRLAGIVLGKLQARDVSLLLANMQRKPRKTSVAKKTEAPQPLAPRTKRYVAAVLHAACAQAVKEGILPRNPCDAVTLPRQERREMQALSPEQAASFIEAAKADGQGPLLTIAILTGLREGELFGLKWSDADLDAGMLRVVRGLQWVARKKGDKNLPQWRWTEGKTARSRRNVTLPAITALRKQKAQQAQDRLRAGSAWTDLDLVFASELGTPLRPSNIARRHLAPVLAAAGCPPIRFHDLRHSHATLLLAAGENVKVVSERLGHASVVLTMDTYQHVLPGMQRGAADRLEAILADAGAKRAAQ